VIIGRKIVEGAIGAGILGVENIQCLRIALKTRNYFVSASTPGLEPLEHIRAMPKANS